MIIQIPHLDTKKFSEQTWYSDYQHTRWKNKFKEGDTTLLSPPREHVPVMQSHETSAERRDAFRVRIFRILFFQLAIYLFFLLVPLCEKLIRFSVFFFRVVRFEDLIGH